MFAFRFFGACFTLLVLAACASSSPKSEFRNFGDLYLCRGLSIANAPISAPDRRVVDYAPTIVVRKNEIIRAPTAGCVSSGFGPRRGGAGSRHEGLDLYTGDPREIVAGGDGRITFMGRQQGYGRTIVIGHRNQVETVYAHLSEFRRGLSLGDRVKRGAYIGRTGESGNATAIHLHYEVRVDGRPIDPLGDIREGRK